MEIVAPSTSQLDASSISNVFASEDANAICLSNKSGGSTGQVTLPLGTPFKFRNKPLTPTQQLQSSEEPLDKISLGNS